MANSGGLLGGAARLIGGTVLTGAAAQGCALALVLTFGPHGWTQPRPPCATQRVCVLVAGLQDDVAIGIGASGRTFGFDVRDDTAQRLADDLSVTTDDGRAIQVLRYPVEIAVPRAGDANLVQAEASMVDQARRLGRDAHANLVVVGRVVNDDNVTIVFVDPARTTVAPARIQYNFGSIDSRTALLQGLSAALSAANSGTPIPGPPPILLPPAPPAPQDAKPQTVSIDPTSPPMAGTIAPSPPTITLARRNALPSRQIMDQLYPRRARDHGTRGQVIVSCAVSADGGLSACDVVRETPPGQGFGDAARTLAQNYTTAFPELHDGDPVNGGRLRVVYTFVPTER